MNFNPSRASTPIPSSTGGGWVAAKVGGVNPPMSERTSTMSHNNKEAEQQSVANVTKSEPAIASSLPSSPPSIGTPIGMASAMPASPPTSLAPISAIETPQEEGGMPSFEESEEEAPILPSAATIVAAVTSPLMKLLSGDKKKKTKAGDEEVEELEKKVEVLRERSGTTLTMVNDFVGGSVRMRANIFEKQLVQKSYEEAEAAKEAAAAGIPLTLVKNPAVLALQKAEKGKRPQSGMLLDTIRRNVEIMQNKGSSENGEKATEASSNSSEDSAQKNASMEKTGWLQGSRSNVRTKNNSLGRKMGLEIKRKAMNNSEFFSKQSGETIVCTPLKTVLVEMQTSMCSDKSYIGQIEFTISTLQTLVDALFKSMNRELQSIYKDLHLSYESHAFNNLITQLNSLRESIARKMREKRDASKLFPSLGLDISNPHETNGIQKALEDSIALLKAQLSEIKANIDSLISAKQKDVTDQEKVATLCKLLLIVKKELDTIMNESQSILRALSSFLYPGEKLLLKEDSITCTFNRQDSVGCLFITNFRMIFLPQEQSAKRHLIPLTMISSVEKAAKKKSTDGVSYRLEISCKDMLFVKLGFVKTKLKCRVVRDMLSQGKKLQTTKLFAFDYKEKFPINGWEIYDIQKEYQRMGVTRSPRWRISNLNVIYGMCESYPNHVVCPVTITDEVLDAVAKYRSRGRLPALSWIHPTNEATITRCSQPMTGVTNRRCTEDEALLRSILAASPNSKLLHILDARPRAAAMGNQAKGAGYEKMTNYENCRLSFLNIPNIHTMRGSFNQLRDAILSTSHDDTKFWAQVEASGWLHYLRLILSGAEKLVKLVNSGQAVLTHCSDGWDRTAQLVSLAEIMMDPYYRTIVGLETLIEKDWLSFGHKFSLRIGHGDESMREDERCPVFHQFVDCLWQITRMYPTYFQYNENFLVALSDHVYSCQFGTFLCNTEKERHELGIRKHTVSLWSYLNSNAIEYINPFYISSETGTIVKVSTVQHLHLWTNYYLRWRPDLHHDNSAERIVQVLLDTQETSNQRIKALEKQLSDMKREMVLMQSQQGWVASKPSSKIQIGDNKSTQS
eukprot:TRINITY_DN4658_c0_g1_i2.p1 TRINITY_DN4658_c0_g1~~TRINITY_DN4658_c0_g1_i2.p1  ORF type:complete len:1077 (+),score=251.60 TRINITY_DN4658_c0_g1_i2:182-3412(+)